MVQFSNIADLKRQPVDKGVQGFPVPMAKQMSQGKKPRHKVRFPKPTKPKGK